MPTKPGKIESQPAVKPRDALQHREARIHLLVPATSLDEVYETLITRPLIDQDQFDAFYREDVNAVRGGDKVLLMVRSLRRSHGGAFYKCFLLGHPGVGKSTEMTRLAGLVADQFEVIRFSAQTDLDAAGFRPFDVLLVMMISLADKMTKPPSEGGLGLKVPVKLAVDIHRWFATEKQVASTAMTTGVGGTAGIKPSPISWEALLGLFVEIKGEIKYTADRKQEVVEYRLNRIATLIGLLNRLLDECNTLLRKRSGREWLFIGEDFDKPGIPPERTESLFLGYANIFNDLNTHLIFNIPITLAYSDKSAQLALQQICIPDTPVFDQKHKPHEPGRKALITVLEARVAPELFEEGQMMRLVVASGGNLRDLFEMTSKAADNAALRPDCNDRVGQEDVTAAINDKRSEYVRRLGNSPYDANPISYDDKAKRLVGIYNQAPGNDVPDPILHSLLRARAVQEFNGTRWFGVHPLVVDTLIKHGKLKGAKGGSIPGGTG